jgi:hypothetical protein
MALEIKVLGFGQAQKCGMVKPINGILTFPILIIGSAMAMQMIKKISNAICCGLFFRFSELRREVVVCFVDIGGIVDHHCLNFL